MSKLIPFQGDMRLEEEDAAQPWGTEILESESVLDISNLENGRRILPHPRIPFGDFRANHGFVLH